MPSRHSSRENQVPQTNTQDTRSINHVSRRRSLFAWSPNSYLRTYLSMQIYFVKLFFSNSFFLKLVKRPCFSLLLSEVGYQPFNVELVGIVFTYTTYMHDGAYKSYVAVLFYYNFIQHTCDICFGRFFPACTRHWIGKHRQD